MTHHVRENKSNEQVICENSIMKDRNGKTISAANVLRMFVMAAMVTAAVTNTATAKSLYLIADVKGSSTDATQPLHAYDIGVDGMLTFQAEYNIPHRMLGGVGLAIDSDSGYLFVTYEASDEIQLIDGTTMTGADRIIADGSADLAGIVYDHTRGLLYCVDRGIEKLYVYDWDAKTTTLTRAPGSPFSLRRAMAWGIALDEIDGFLYVANARNTINVYDTSDWSLIDQIELSRIAISIAIDVMNGYIYTGGAYAGNNYLTQYHLASGKEREVLVEPTEDAGVMGLGIDPDTGLVYMTTGKNNAPGGDNLLVYDMELREIGRTYIGGNAAGLAIPGKDIGFNPLNLTKELIRGAVDEVAPGEMLSVGAGKTITYGIGFSNTSNEYTVTGVSIVDALPHELTFVTASDDGVGGHYDSKTHTYRWSYADLPPGSSTLLELTVRVDRHVEVETVITNSVTINSNETSPSTTKLDVVATNNFLNLDKSILGAAEGQVAKVEPNEIITYSIYFDNYVNDFTVTDILLIDTLPPAVDFIYADEIRGSGRYDQKSHTYIWRPWDLEPGSSVRMNLVVQVNPDLAADTVITNSVIIDSNETPASVVSVDAIVSRLSNLPGITKSIAGSIEGQVTLVEANEKITYLIHINNSDALTDVSVVDTLPPEVERILEANPKGQEHRDKDGNITYTWILPDLQPKASTDLKLVVQLKKVLDPGTIISNSATIYTHEALPETASVDATTLGLVVTKLAIEDVPDDGVMPIEWVDINDTFTYLVRIENKNNFALTNVRIDDKLPERVTLVSDPDTRIYKESIQFMAAGTTKDVRLRVKVSGDTPVGTAISNSVSVESDGTLPVTASVDVTAGDPEDLVALGGYVIVTPNVLRDNNSTNDLLCTIQLPPRLKKDDPSFEKDDMAGFEDDDIEKRHRLRAVFIYQEDIRDYIAPVVPVVVPAKRQILLEESGPAKILATFDRAQVMDALTHLGRWSMVIKGRYENDEGELRTYRGKTDTGVFVTRFAGN